MSYHLTHALIQSAVGLTFLAIVVAPAWLLRRKDAAPVEIERWPEGWYHTDGLDRDDES